MVFYGEVGDKKSFSVKFFEFFAQLMPDNDDQVLFRSIVEPFSAGDNQTAANKMTTDAAKKTKIFCDAYLLQKFKAGLSGRMKQLGDNSSEKAEEPIDKVEEDAAIP